MMMVKKAVFNLVIIVLLVLLVSCGDDTDTVDEIYQIEENQTEYSRITIKHFKDEELNEEFSEQIISKMPEFFKVKFDGYDRKIEETYVKNNQVIYKKEYIYSTDQPGSTQITNIIYYDKMNKITREDYYTDGVFTDYIEYEYDKRMRKIAERKYLPDGTRHGNWKFYSYEDPDQHALVSKIEVYHFGTLVSSTEMEFSATGEKTAETKKDAEGNLIYHYDFAEAYDPAKPPKLPASSNTPLATQNKVDIVPPAANRQQLDLSNRLQADQKAQVGLPAVQRRQQVPFSLEKKQVERQKQKLQNLSKEQSNNKNDKQLDYQNQSGEASEKSSIDAEN